MLRRISFTVGGVIVSLAVAMAPAFGAEPGPDAIVVDSEGTIVSVAATRGDVADVFERAALESIGRPLTLEFIYRTHGTVTQPVNDPEYFRQWNFEAVGVPGAWALVDGTGVVVAVLDSAVNVLGEDGFCKPMVSPYDAIDQVEGLAALNTSAEFGHGTHVAGTVAQCTNNFFGVAGIAPGVSIMPVRVLNDSGSGTSSTLARGIDWAVQHGADVINMSLGLRCFDTWPKCVHDQIVDAALARASAAGVLVVASAGNTNAAFVDYPSAHPDVLSVGAVDSSDTVWIENSGVGSNSGSGLDLVAPGKSIVQETTVFGEYDYVELTGTSMAAPHVSGAAALMLSYNPSLSVENVRSILVDTALDIGTSGFDLASGWGRLEVGAAVAAATPATSSDNPCPFGFCDSVAWVDDGGVWGLWGELSQSPAVKTFYYGNPGDLPFMGDWNGDGEATPGLFRQSDGYVYVRYSNTQGNADLEFFFGDPGDIPLVGDFDGDGSDSVSIWRPSEARVYIINKLGQQGKGLGAAEYFFTFGQPGDVPFVGDFDGDGVDTIALYRPSNGYVYIKNTLTSGAADLSLRYGDSGDQILAGDWNGDGKDTLARYRPSTGRIYVNFTNSASAPDWEAVVGSYLWLVVAGN